MDKMVSWKEENSVLSITVEIDSVDANTARAFKDEVGDLLSDKHESVEIDLGRVNFMDSSGIGALLNIYKKLGKGEGQVKLLHVKPEVLTVIELLRLHRVFNIIPA